MADKEEYITLTDEEGHEHNFVVIDVLEVDDKQYAILVPAEETEDDGSDEDAVILRIESDEDGEDILVDIEDDSEFEKVVGAWEELLADEEDDVEDDEDDEDEK